MRPRRIGCAVLLGLTVCLAGCNIIGAIVVMLAPPQMQDAEVELTQGRLAILIEYAQPQDENPVFTHAFRERLVDVFREQKVNDQVVPGDEVFRLRQLNADFNHWSLQRVGRAVNADQVLYVRIDSLRMQESSDNPLLSPQVRLHMKLIATDESSQTARLWPGPEEREGREIGRGRHTRVASDAVLYDAEAAKLAKDAAWLAAKPFYKFDLEETDPWEP